MHFYLIFANLHGNAPLLIFSKRRIILGGAASFLALNSFRLTLSIRKSLSSPFFFTLLQQQRQRLICLFFLSLFLRRNKEFREQFYKRNENTTNQEIVSSNDD